VIRRIRRSVATAAAVVIAAALVGAGCTTDRPPQRRFQVGPERAPAWSARMPVELGRPLRAQPAGDVVLVQGEKGVAAFARGDGAPRWQRAGGDRNDLVAIAGTAVVIVAASGGVGAPGRILDLATGSDRAAFPVSGPHSVAVTSTAVYAVSGLNPGRTPRYRLSAYDPANGAVRWQRDIADRVQLADWATGLESPPLAAPAAGEIVVNLETAEADVWAVTGVAADTGAEIARLAQPVRNLAHTRQRVADGTLLQWDSTGSECAMPTTAYDIRTGQQRWRQTFGRWEPASAPGGPRCGPGTAWNPRVGAARLLTTSADERPQVNNLASGSARWTGPAGQYPVLMTGDVVLTRAERGAGDLVGADTTAGAERWRIPAGAGEQIVDIETAETAAVGGRFLLTAKVLVDDVKPITRVLVLDARTGKSEWASDTGAHLLGAAVDGTVTGRWADPLVGQVPTEVRYYPSF